MALVRLGICIIGVYSMFLLWAVAQERLSVPFSTRDGSRSDKFKSALLIGTCQSALSAVSSLLYILARRVPGERLVVSFGLEPATTTKNKLENHKKNDYNHSTNGNTDGFPTKKANTRFRRSTLLYKYLQCAVSITIAAPFGFAALSHISYPAMVLGKSCKLVPVMLMNVLLYRRIFAPHKYLVVAMVTAGITMFMHFGPDKHGSSKKAADTRTSSSVIGILYLLINLGLDGATNSTQDEVFARFRVTGQQMMFWINVCCTLLTTALMTLPLPHIPVLHPASGGVSEFASAMQFVREHPGVVMPLVQFAVTGALGQLFIFETLQHFGSLTLVTITLTRKLFTMVLSVIVYDHKLAMGQWAGAAVVFAGISVEAWVKRKDIHAKRVMQEKEKATIKTL